jgi:hypothetical protein
MGEQEKSPMSIDAALLRTVVRDAEMRTSADGKPWMSIIVRSGDGDAASFVQVAIFGDAAVALGRIERNEKLYAEGSIRINEWTTAAGHEWQEEHGARDCWRRPPHAAVTTVRAIGARARIFP